MDVCRANLRDQDFGKEILGWTAFLFSLLVPESTREIGLRPYISYLQCRDSPRIWTLRGYGIDLKLVGDIIAVPGTIDVLGG